MSFIVAIDGPAGTGKGTVAKIIAEKMNLVNIDTGATYRCVTLDILNKKIDFNDEQKIKELLDNIEIEFKNIDGKELVILNGQDVTDEIRSKRVNEFVSQISSIEQIRINMSNLQRKMGLMRDSIMEGRDIGTYVFPNANVKIYLDADVEERARRRFIQNQEKNINMSYEEILENIKMRDSNDKAKKLGALKIADDAIVIDTTNLTIDNVVEKIINIINLKKGVIKQ